MCRRAQIMKIKDFQITKGMKINMKLKKTVALFLAVAFSIPVSANAASFVDVRGHWAEATIKSLADKGVVKGVTSTRFNPDGNVTRAEFLKMMMEVTDIATSAYRYGECLDANGSDWFSPYLQSALDRGLIPQDMIAGYSVKVVKSDNGSTRAVYEGAFNGNISISREEMAYLTQELFQYTRNARTMNALKTAEEITFSDASNISPWAYDTVSLACAQGFITGMGDNRFEPKQTATRAQAATIVSRVMDAE